MKKKETANINPDQQQGDHEYIFFFWWVVGISMLTVALLISAGMGLVQEKLYREHGKHPDEALYYIVLMIFALISCRGLFIKLSFLYLACLDVARFPFPLQRHLQSIRSIQPV